MMRIGYIFLLLGVLCFGRDNPFSPVENIAKFTQVVKKDNHFQGANFTLPDSSRVLKKVIVVYQNLDGSISQKDINIDKNVDWHHNFMLSYENVVKKDLHVEAQMPTKTQDIKSYSFRDFIKFTVGKKVLVISTKDSKIRDFMVSNPYKIVFDFKRNVKFLIKIFNVNIPPFVSIVLGNHNDYYRVAIQLDGQYTYKISKNKDDYTITLQ